MRNYKIAFVFFSFLWSLSAHAGDWRAIVERAGFMGTLAAGASYEWRPEHATDLSIGGYPIDDETFYQANFVYRYSRWNSPVGHDMWRPLQFGFFMVYALNSDKYFLESPDKYPYPDYYDFTALRYGAEFGTTYTFMRSRIGLAYRIRIFDNGVIAIFNNTNRDLQYYISSGFSLQYLF
ncbi:hypothetical protein QJS83_05080 [Bdellovibrio sp. 22V]|uniref:hypothetical protein n=1 Tax=Bdellovibrio TaxID=958 RepID=UPI002542E107|nr:hypothetical protein [Bdellovibrio sp. 22V]WII73240.1 hypothetical protein QJS83_05080 [Bdellovibrio sp. 22V]